MKTEIQTIVQEVKGPSVEGLVEAYKELDKKTNEVIAEKQGTVVFSQDVLLIDPQKIIFAIARTVCFDIEN